MNKLLTILHISAVMAALALLIFLLRGEGFDNVDRIGKEGEYTICSSQLVPRREVTSFAVGDDKIYLYYDSVGIVNIYDHDGGFLYGI